MMINLRITTAAALGIVFGAVLTATWLSRPQTVPAGAEPPPANATRAGTPVPLVSAAPGATSAVAGRGPAVDVRAEHLEQALEAGDYQRAVEQFERIYQHADDARVEHYRRMLIDFASRLLHSEQITACIELLTPYLDLFYKDSDALITLAQAHREANDLLAAITAFQQAWTHEHRASVRRLIDGQLNWTTNLYVQQLQEQDDKQQTAELFNYLIEVRPENPHHYLALAQAYLALEQYDNAQFVLRHIERDTVVGRQARELLRHTARNSF